VPWLRLVAAWRTVGADDLLHPNDMAAACQQASFSRAGHGVQNCPLSGRIAASATGHT
jgi:hypothetical protein